MPVSSGPCGAFARNRSVRTVRNRAWLRDTKPRSEPITYAVSAKPMPGGRANDGDGNRSGARPFCLFVVSQKKRKVRRSRLLMTGSPSFSGSYTREPSTVTPGMRSLLAPSDGAPTSSTVSPASTCRLARSPRKSAFIGQSMHHDTSLRARDACKNCLRPRALTRCRLSPADVEAQLECARRLPVCGDLAEVRARHTGGAAEVLVA